MSANLGKYVTCDATKCSGCRACELACFAEHNKATDSKDNGVGNTVGTVEIPVTSKVYVTFLEDGISAAIQCKHCEDAPCLNVCSKGAIERIDGQVIIDTSKCIGCKDCMLACPFGAIDLMPVYENKKAVSQNEKEVAKAASKCDLCKGNPDGPACVRVCPNKALRVVEPSDEKKAKNVKAAQALYEASVERA